MRTHDPLICRCLYHASTDSRHSIFSSSDTATQNAEEVFGRDSIFDVNLKQLSHISKEMCDTPISVQECGTALFKILANNKSPGIDGFTTEFYKFFWHDIKNLVF